MATFKEWERHFDIVPKTPLKKYMAAIELLRTDAMIEKNYGNDLGSLYRIMNNSISWRK